MALWIGVNSNGIVEAGLIRTSYVLLLKELFAINAEGAKAQRSQSFYLFNYAEGVVK